MRHVGKVVLVLCMIVFLCCASADAMFDDMGGHWAEDRISAVSKLGIINGYRDNSFRPDMPITREEFISIIVKAFGVYDERAEASFDDVDKEDWYYKNVASAYKAGITHGVGRGRFGVGENISREDMCVLVARALATEVGGNAAYSFSDMGDISYYATSAIEVMTRAGFINGYYVDNGRYEFRPQGLITRAEVCVIMSNVMPHVTGDFRKLSILLYHHVADSGDSATVISRERLEEHIRALSYAGYKFVTYDEVIRYVHDGVPLPMNAVCLDFDDGYLSNYAEVYPLLQKYSAKANMFIIGTHVGKSLYKDLDIPIIPHFNYRQAREMVESGLVQIGSHTYDMHQWADYEDGRAREDILPWAGEDLLDYERVLSSDNRKMNDEIFNQLGRRNYVVAYPGGRFDENSERVLRAEGMKVTLGARNGLNYLVKGDMDGLFGMNRVTVHGGMSVEEILELVR